jgi:hypothetical protein
MPQAITGPYALSSTGGNKPIVYLHPLKDLAPWSYPAATSDPKADLPRAILLQGEAT